MDSSRHGLLITGTDTGVGKTFVTAGLARLWRDGGLRPGVFKPVETGHDPARGSVPEDARRLREAVGATNPVDEVVPYVFAPPVAPLVAARAAARPIEPERLQQAFERAVARHDFVLAEGAGGLSVPLAEFGENDRLFDYADLARLLDLPLLVVARAHLGTLNHTFLTVDYARRRGVPVVGVVLNGRDRARADASVEENAALVEEMNDLRVFGVIDWLGAGDPSVEDMAAACRDSIDLEGLERALAQLDVSPFASAKVEE